MKKKAKRSYKKPEVFEVKLTPEEAVLQICKTGAGTGAPKGSGTKCRGGTCGSTIGS